jgi:hypothetical protein
LVRVPGFFSRQGEPHYVGAYGVCESRGETRRYTVEHLRGAFLGWPVGAPVDAPPTAIGRQSQAEEAELRKARVGELVSKGLSIEQATEHMIAERELQQRIDSIAARG